MKHVTLTVHVTDDQFGPLLAAVRDHARLREVVVDLCDPNPFPRFHLFRRTNYTRVIRSDGPLSGPLRRIRGRRGWQDSGNRREEHRP